MLRGQILWTQRRESPLSPALATLLIWKALDDLENNEIHARQCQTWWEFVKTCKLEGVAAYISSYERNNDWAIGKRTSLTCVILLKDVSNMDLLVGRLFLKEMKCKRKPGNPQWSSFRWRLSIIGFSWTLCNLWGCQGAMRKAPETSKSFKGFFPLKKSRPGFESDGWF